MVRGFVGGCFSRRYGLVAGGIDLGNGDGSAIGSAAAGGDCWSLELNGFTGPRLGASLRLCGR